MVARLVSVVIVIIQELLFFQREYLVFCNNLKYVIYINLYIKFVVILEIPVVDIK